MATKLGLEPELLPTDWRYGADPAAIENRLEQDRAHAIKAVCVVHNETSTGVVSRVGEVRRAIDRARHPALLLVDTISSLASIDFRMDEWGVDVTVAGSQKGLMLPPGLSFNALTTRALAASKSASCRSRFGAGTRCCSTTRTATSRTAVVMPEGHSADKLRKTILEAFDMSLGTGLGRLADKVFRIGHLGHFNDLTLAGTLCGVETGLRLAGVPRAAASKPRSIL